MAMRVEIKIKCESDGSTSYTVVEKSNGLAGVIVHEEYNKTQKVKREQALEKTYKELTPEQEKYKESLKQLIKSMRFLDNMRFIYITSLIIMGIFLFITPFATDLKPLTASFFSLTVLATIFVILVKYEYNKGDLKEFGNIIRKLREFRKFYGISFNRVYIVLEKILEAQCSYSDSYNLSHYKELYGLYDDEVADLLAIIVLLRNV